MTNIGEHLMAKHPDVPKGHILYDAIFKIEQQMARKNRVHLDRLRESAQHVRVTRGDGHLKPSYRGVRASKPRWTS